MLLFIVSPQKTLLEIGIEVNLKPVNFNFTKVKLTAILTKVSTVLNLVDETLYF